MNAYPALLQVQTMLKQLDHLLVKAEDHAREQKYDVENLLRSRLIANMYDLRKQVQVTTDNAKFLAYRLTGKEAPAFEDSPTATLADLRARVAKVSGLLSEFSEKDFEGFSERKIPVNFRPGKYMTGKDYFQTFSLPNFFFHISAVYMILRANGVPLAKLDYLGEIPLHDI